MMKYFAAIIFFQLLLLTGYAQVLLVKKDLKAEWLVYDGSEYVYFNGEQNAPVYFYLHPESYKTDRLHIAAPGPISVFVNGRLAGSGKTLSMDIDSLRKRFSDLLLVGVFHPAIDASRISTSVLTHAQQKPTDDFAPRVSFSFRDFVIIATLLLVSMLVIIIQTNPKLASDYLSIARIFSLREADDVKVHARLTNSTNLLFYGYISLLVSYFLMIIFHFVSARYAVAFGFQTSGFGNAMFEWLRLALIIMSVLVVRIILVFGLSLIFGIGDVAGIHFFNLVRALLVFVGVLSAVLFVYFISRGYNESVYIVLLKIFGWITGAWMLLIFLKLAGKSGTSLFHLFSYICATELIPFLIILKVLYN